MKFLFELKKIKNKSKECDASENQTRNLLHQSLVSENKGARSTCSVYTGKLVSFDVFSHVCTTLFV